ncbi:MAG TPA: chloride channel protein [Pseudobdellovibrionaceae bacterium]|nr:chloride channel protein [Pseudobdellovibrionaceae bacterium]
MKTTQTIRNMPLRWIFLSAASGFLAGAASALFLILLDWATNTRSERPAIIWGLPLAGFLIGWIYHHYGKDSAAGNNLILDEIHDPKKVVPLAMAPLILFSTLLTHLFGGSAGREGTAVQMGASLSDQLGRFFKVGPEERKILLVTGAGAGFGAAIGAPWAGVLFGMEVLHIGRLRPFALVQSLMASFVGYFTAVKLGAPHSVFPNIGQLGPLNYKWLFYILIAGIFFGIAAKLFTLTTHFIEKQIARVRVYPPLKLFVFGCFLVVLFYIEGSYKYVGLGIDSIQEAFISVSSFEVPLLKSFFTSLTIGSGFKGGEFIPLVFIGTTLGSALSLILPVSFQLLASVGFAAVFAGAANIPITCSMMAVELFGLPIAPYALVACFASYYFSGHHGIYKSQRIKSKKHPWHSTFS